MAHVYGTRPSKHTLGEEQRLKSKLTCNVAYCLIFIVSFLSICLGADDYTEWTHSRRLLLNTSSTGAGIAENVTNVPVLLRLNPGNFKYFSQVRDTGADLRFAKSNGTHLPYQIERWAHTSAAIDTAEIWILIDTVYGNSPSQSITMYWGNATAADSSNSAAVFDTANGFAAVYHFAEDGNITGGGYKDATVNANDGTGMSMTTTSDTAGVLGMCSSFDGTADYIRIPSHTSLNPTTISVSAWIKPSKWTDSYTTIISKQETATPWKGIDFRKVFGDSTARKIEAGFVGANDSSFQKTGGDVSTGIWQHVAFTYNGSALYIYNNGLKSDSLVKTGSIAPSASEINIGRNPGTANRWFKGLIDEVTLSGTARSANWIKLAYENQKTAQTLIPTVPVLTWDTSVTTGTQAGNGTWGESSYWSSNGTQLHSWLGQGHTARFGGSAGTYAVTVSGRQVLDSLAVLTGCSFSFTGDTLDFGTNSGIYVTDLVTTIASVIAGSSGLSKHGTGTLRLLGDNIYTGPTAVTSGKLFVDGSLAAGSAVTVAAGTTLGGSGNIGGGVSAGGATIAPGSSGPGAMRVGSLTLSGTSRLDIELGSSSDTIVVAGNCTLDGIVNILPAAGLHSGTYRFFTCGGTVQNNTVTIGTTPAGRSCTITTGAGYVDAVITTHMLQSVPADTEIAEGKSLTFTATAVGAGALSYRWERFPADSVGATASLAIALLDTSYNGARYRCIVTDQYEADTSGWATVSILKKPRITLQPRDSAVAIGKGAGFSVAVQDTAQTTYIWRKVGSSTSLGTKSTYVISAVAASHQGEYYCTITNRAGAVSSDTVLLTIIGLPVARFTCAPLSGTVPLSVTFTDSSTGSITSRKWTFGDSTSDTAKNATHLYTTTGQFTVQLSVVGPGGSDISETISITVRDSTPAARFGYTPISGVVPLNVTFSDSSTGVITSRKWTFGDSKSDTAKNPKHTYTTTGKFPIVLTVSGPGGADTSEIVYITVTDSTPKAYFGFTPATGTAPLTVLFSDSSGGVVSSWKWSFGDGTSDIAKNPRHTYTTSGTYDVRLTVNGPGGSDSLTRTSAVTVAMSPFTRDSLLQQAISLSSLTFDSTTASLRISWCLDSAVFSDELDVGIAYRIGEKPDSMTGTQIISSFTRCTDTVITLFEPVRFDTLYYVSLFVRQNGATSWPAAADSSTKSVRIGSPYRQVIVFEGTSTGIDTLNIFNDRIQLREDPDYRTFEFTDTIATYTFTPPAGFTVAGSPVVFLTAGSALPFYLGIRINDLPDSLTISDVRIYRDSAGVVTVEHSSYVDTAAGIVYLRTKDLKKPFIAMIDTRAPVASFKHTPDSIAHADDDLVDSVSISDNIANVQWWYLYSKGDQHPAVRDSGTLRTTSRVIRVAIPRSSQAISAEFGLRALFVVSDGVSRDTLNLSRSVFRQKSDAFTTTANSWCPVYATAQLFSSHPDSAILSRVNTENTYDERYARLFRWATTSGSKPNDATTWIEYNPSNKSTRSLFSVTPGRLFWLKTLTNQPVHLGDARTLSLSDTFSIELPPEQYTDFGMPFRFGVQVRDILAAGKHTTDSVHFYSWVRDSSTNRYVLKPLYIHSMAGVNDTMTILKFSEQGGYSLYNPHDRALVVQIPPTLAQEEEPATIAKRAKGVSTTSTDKLWGARCIIATAGTELPAVYCGYAPGLKKCTFPVAPTFLPLRAYLFDRTTGLVAGHSIDDDAAGGIVKELLIVNSSDSAQRISYRFETAGAFPKNYSATLFDGSTGRFSEHDSIDVAAHSSASRWLVVGTSDFFTTFKTSTASFSYGLSRIYPNPSRSIVNFRFSVGFGTQEQLLLTIFDLHGRKVWEKKITTLLAAGEHMITWNGYDRQRSVVGAGRYPVRLSFINSRGETVRKFEQMLTYLP